MKARLAWLAALALIGVAVAADAFSPAQVRTPEGITVPTQGGALACPLAMTPNVQAPLHIANLAKVPSRVRVSVIPKRGKTRVVAVEIPGSSIKVVLLDRLVRGDGCVRREQVTLDAGERG